MTPPASSTLSESSGSESSQESITPQADHKSSEKEEKFDSAFEKDSLTHPSNRTSTDKEEHFDSASEGSRASSSSSREDKTSTSSADKPSTQRFFPSKSPEQSSSVEVSKKQKHHKHGKNQEAKFGIK